MPTRIFHRLFATLVVLAGMNPASAQEAFPSIFDQGTLFQWSGRADDEPPPDKRAEPLVTDRPDFTEASTTVGRGVAQAEMGYTFFLDNEAGSRFVGHTYPEMLWRIGLFADWFEFRIAYTHASENVTEPFVPNATTTGAQDLYLGAKFALTNQAGWLPEMALMPQMLVPTGHADFTSDEVLPGMNWLYGWDINDFLACGGSTQGNIRLDETGSDYLQMAQSFTVNYTLADRWSGYTEWFAFFPTGADLAKPEHYFDGGLVFQLTPNVQFDVRAGVGLNAAAVDMFSGTGLAIRF